ncbi:hypothetical protein ZIOFF_035500 [Zingiber officinale]|uniref:Cyclic nucleotide-binding domain-containing protein n=1 Tax=Zingiber officinale TaxID=94328 RepID=A0A8J5GEP8_ZINOF|nr:hypothetical protein ZIOFF_035500 [Zingiber officinale]
MGVQVAGTWSASTTPSQAAVFTDVVSTVGSGKRKGIVGCTFLGAGKSARLLRTRSMEVGEGRGRQPLGHVFLRRHAFGARTECFPSGGVDDGRAEEDNVEEFVQRLEESILELQQQQGNGGDASLFSASFCLNMSSPSSLSKQEPSTEPPWVPVFNMPLAMMCGIEAEKEISRDGSHYSLSTGILPSLGARSNRRVKLRRFIVSPYDRRYRSGVLFPLPLLGRTPFFPLEIVSCGICSGWKACGVFSLVLCLLFVQIFSLLHVSEMNAEYYPPREDVILQNEAPTDFYILVTGTAVETRTLEELEELLEFSCQNRTSLTRIMLDNMVVPFPNGDVDVSMLKDAVQLVNGRFEIEVHVKATCVIPDIENALESSCTGLMVQKAYKLSYY